MRTVLAGHPPGTSRAAPAWALLVTVVVAAPVLLVVPGLRPAAAVVSAWTATTLVLAGSLRHRPRPWLPWLLMVGMLALWSCALTVLSVRGAQDHAVVVLVGAGQVVACAVTALMVRPGRSPRQGPPSREGIVEAVVITTVLGLVGAQLAAVAMSGAPSGTGVLVPVVDITIIGLLLRFLVTYRMLQPAGYLLAAAALVTVVHDLASALQGVRLVAPGDPVQVVGTVSCLLFAVAALHPSMGTVFAPQALARRRPPSAALLGLLPLVTVPLALWWVADVTATRGLATPVLLAGACVVAALCLLRGAGALRGSEHLAEHDPLTDLVNRRGLARQFDQAPPPAGWGLLIVDLDEFKQVNDTHGHALGDALLQQVRDRLLTAAGPSATVSRTGGDEFVILTGPDDAETVAEACVRSLRDPVRVRGLDLRTSASVGVAGPDPDADLEELTTRADIALYAAKAAGRDTTAVYEPRMRQEVAHRYGLTGELQRLLGHAPAGPEGALEVHYQPLVELGSGRPVGAEALVRWAHPRLGLLAPSSFLDLVTTSGLDADLDTAVLTQVVRQLATWRQQGRTSLPVSVNLTTASLADPRLDERVLGLLAASAVPTSLLHVEITEHEELPPNGPAARTLRRLSAAGIAVHLDDYGTGYSSVSYLRRFPIKVLKLDRSVVEAITEPEHAQLVTAITAMARTLGLDLLAEGVETPAQRTALASIGVRLGQGYLFSRPLTPTAYAEEVLDDPARPLPSTTPSPRGAPRPRTPVDTRSPDRSPSRPATT